MEFAIAGVAIIPLVLGLVEFSKRLGVKGDWLLVEAVGIGSVFSGVAYAMQSNLIPDPWKTIITVAIVALSGGLGAAGLYDLGKKWTGNGK